MYVKFDFVVKIDEAVVELIDISALIEVAILVDELMRIDSVVIVSIDFIVVAVVGSGYVDFVVVVVFVDTVVVVVKMADDAVPPNEGLGGKEPSSFLTNVSVVEISGFAVDVDVFKSPIVTSL